MYYRIDWEALSRLSAAERLKALAAISTSAQRACSAERERIVHAELARHGGPAQRGSQKAAAEALKLKQTRMNQLTKETPMTVTISHVAAASLHRQYQGQTEPQDCYVEVDLTNAHLMADYNAEVGNAVPVEVFHGFERRYEIPALTGDAANDLLEEIRPLAERMVSDWEKTWDGNNMVAVLGDDAKAAEAEIEALCEGMGEDSEKVTVWDVDGATNGEEVSEYDITAATTDERLDEIEEEIRSSLAEVSDSGEVALEGVDEYLRGLRDELAADDE